MESDLVKINMFGRLCIQRGNQRITHFRTEKTGLLLACLAQDPQRRYRREELIDRVWPDYEPEAGRNNLRVSLASLRQQLESDDKAHGGVLIADRQEIHLRPSSYTTDKAEFEANLLRATRARDEPARLRYLQAAVEQYQADLLPEYGDLWITAERQRLSDSYILALRRLVKAHINFKEYENALVMAQKAVQADPHREESHRLLMQVYALLGRPAAAVRQYRELETHLQTNLGAAPSRSTQSVLNQVCERVGITTPPPAADIRPAKPTPPPERPAPPLPLFRLPVSLTRLVGRDDDILQVAEMLNTPETRLVTLTGMGGVGKTRLALAVAEQIQTEAKRNVCFLSLAGLTQPELIVPTLAAKLQLPLRPRNSLWERLVTALSAAPLLLVLDNWEHLLPEGADLLQRLLEAAPTATFLATSRQRINIPGEYAYMVRPLSTVASAEDPAQLKTCPGVQLWLERVQAIRPDFQITTANMKDVAALCRQLEGIPLAIELAAGWAGALAPGQIVTRLNNRFDLLKSRQPNIEARHASLRAALESSFQLLTPPVQRFFARLGLFHGGWTLEAAEAVCDEPEALEYMAQLCERSLVYTFESGSELRYSFLETVREYALCQLTGEARTEAECRLQAYFTHLAGMAEAGLRGPDQIAWLHCLKEEEDNLRAVLKQALSDSAMPSQALKLAIKLFRFWHTRGDSREGRTWLSEALAHAPPDAEDRAAALMALGNLAYSEGDFAQAEAYYTGCLALREAAGDTRGIAAALGSMGNVVHRQGDMRRARALLQQSLAFFQQLNDLRGQALTQGNLATIAMDDSEDALALTHVREALALFRKLGDIQNIMVALTNASFILLRLGQERNVQEYLSDSLALCLQVQSNRDLAQILACSAFLARRRGETGIAMQLLGASAQLRDCNHVILDPQGQEEQDCERRRLMELLGADRGRRQWDNGCGLSQQAMVEMAQGLLGAR